MKQQTIRIIAAFGFLLLLTSASASAQTEPNIRSIQIPFSFTVGEKQLPAGEYRVERVKKDSDLVWLIQRRDSHGTAMALTSTVGGAKHGAAELVFHRYGREYFLAQIWPAGGNVGRELPTERREREVAQQRAERRLEIVTARRE